MVDRKKVVLITNIPTPYRIPLFNELNDQLKNNGYDLTILFGALGYKRRKWECDMSLCKFQFKVLEVRTISLFDEERVIFTYGGLYKVLREIRPDVVITNGFTVSTMKLWFLSWFKDLKYIIWSGAIENSKHPTSTLRMLQRKIMVQRPSGFVAYGTKAKDYLFALGASEDQIEIAINTVDTSLFSAVSLKRRMPMSGERDRKKLLYVGHLTQGKRVDNLLRVAALLKEKTERFELVLVGDGVERAALERLAVELDVQDYVSFEGFKQQSELMNYYFEASCFLFPSEYDIWGLVLVEAMAAGLPCIASIYAGATDDLVKEGVTGYKVDFSNHEEVAERIQWIFEDPVLANRVGQYACMFIRENVNLKKSAEGFCSAVQKVLQSRS